MLRENHHAMSPQQQQLAYYERTLLENETFHSLITCRVEWFTLSSKTLVYWVRAHWEGWNVHTPENQYLVCQCPMPSQERIQLEIEHFCKYSHWQLEFSISPAKSNPIDVGGNIRPNLYYSVFFVWELWSLVDPSSLKFILRMVSGQFSARSQLDPKNQSHRDFSIHQ